MKIPLELNEAEAWVLLRFLRLMDFGVPEQTLADRTEVAHFKEASEKLRVALRDVLEPGWRDEPDTP